MTSVQPSLANANDTGWTWFGEDRSEPGPEHEAAVWQALHFKSKEHAPQFENVFHRGTATTVLLVFKSEVTLPFWAGHSDAASSADGQVLL